MLGATSLRNALITPGHSRPAVLFPDLQEKFLVRQPASAMEARFSFATNEVMRPSPRGQRSTDDEDVLVRLPSLRQSKWKVRVLQRWIGEVESVESDRFVATITDATSPRNPAEQVELDLNEVSKSDRWLVAEGATFYWSIGYRDTLGGQRERISVLRFVRQPRLSQATLAHMFERADILAAFLEH